MLEALLPPHTPRARNSWRTSVACAALLACCCGLARAQTPQPSPPADVKTDDKAVVKTVVAGDGGTRTRRTAEAPAETHAPDAAAAHPLDELDALRAQIAAATDDNVRAGLQRQLLERLAAASDKPAALAELRLLLHEDRFDPQFFYNLGNMLARLGDASAATDAYRKAVSQRHGHYARALNNLGVILLRQGRWDEAHDALTAALADEHNTYAEASYNLGRLYLLRGEADLAIRQWRHTLALQPDHADAVAALARAYAEDGDARRGIAVLDAYAARSARTGAGVPVTVVHARRELIEAGVEAKEEDRSGVNRGGMSDTGRAAMNAGRAPSVGAATRLRPLTIEPAAYAVLQRARAAREAGWHEESVKLYRDVLARNGGYFPPATLELAFALVNLKRNDEALAALNTLVTRDNARYPVAHYHLGRLYELSGQFERAATEFARAAELYGDDNPQPLIDLSRVRERLGDNAAALAALEAYTRATAAQGTQPDWIKERLAKLRTKAAPQP